MPLKPTFDYKPLLNTNHTYTRSEFSEKTFLTFPGGSSLDQFKFKSKKKLAFTRFRNLCRGNIRKSMFLNSYTYYYFFQPFTKKFMLMFLSIIIAGVIILFSTFQGSGICAQKWYCSFGHQTFHISILQCWWRFRLENYRFCICQTLNQRVPTSFIK